VAWRRGNPTRYDGAIARVRMIEANMTAAVATEKTTKDAVLEMIRKMPDNVSMAEIYDAVHLRYRIEQSLRDIEAGNVVSHEEVVKRMAKWLI
jgi:hypothetical protein